VPRGYSGALRRNRRSPLPAARSVHCVRLGAACVASRLPAIEVIAARQAYCEIGFRYWTGAVGAGRGIGRMSVLFELVLANRLNV